MLTTQVKKINVQFHSDWNTCRRNSMPESSCYPEMIHGVSSGQRTLWSIALYKFKSFKRLLVNSKDIHEANAVSLVDGSPLEVAAVTSVFEIIQEKSWLHELVGFNTHLDVRGVVMEKLLAYNSKQKIHWSHYQRLVELYSSVKLTLLCSTRLWWLN